MGITDSSLLDLIQKVRSWISWVASEQLCLSRKFEMSDKGCKMCCECKTNLAEISHRYHCQSCGGWLCEKCIRGYELLVVESDSVKIKAEGGGGTIKSCKSCSNGVRREGGRKFSEKVYPSASPQESPRESPEPPSPCFSGERISSSMNSESIHSDHLAHYLETREYGYSPHAMTCRSMTSFSGHPSPVSVRHSPCRSDEDEAEDSGKQVFSPSSEYCRDNSDIESSSLSARRDFYSFMSVGSSPSDSPSGINFTSSRVGLSVQQGQEGSPICQNDGPFNQETMAVLRKPGLLSEDPDNNDDCSDDLSIFRSQYEKSQRPLDFENNGHIWFPPPHDDENDEAESNFFSYDDEDDDIGDSGAMFTSSSSLSSMFPAKEKQNEGNKEPLRAVVQGHFRALVSQLLQGEGIKVGKENGAEDWLDIVTSIAWQAANFVKPDTSRGGSMDPGAYVKVKCIPSGSPSESTLIKGVVCTKNIKHKRMTSQYKNPRLLLLGGALEYQKVPNQLASFDTLLQQENDHLKVIISKIEALRPNVLLVEKSVSSYAQDHLLAKEISLVLNVKRSLLERIARCTGAHITPSVDNISAARLGHCELFRLERVSEEHESPNQFNKKPSKTLMFFEGCPRRLGCTVLLKGICREELKKVKHVVQFAVFAAYHLSLETSFLADEGASLPKMTLKHLISGPERTMADLVISAVPNSLASTSYQAVADGSVQDEEVVGLNLELEGLKSLSRHLDIVHPLSIGSMNCRVGNAPSDAFYDDLASSVGLESCSSDLCMDLKGSTPLPCVIRNLSQPEPQESVAQEEGQTGEMNELRKSVRVDDKEISSEYFSATETHQSILVSFSSHCVLKGTVCERSRLLRIKFYGCFDKPLGRYLRDDLFDQTSCRSCKEPAEAHVLCYTHQQGNLTINVRCLPSLRLPGEKDGKIWMWHRCLRCAHVDGVPPATRRVVMSDAAWGLSFGKFLELSFSNHATANRVAPCGHSLQRDCLRYYGFGSMVAFFRYSPIDILSVHLPPSVLDFNGNLQHEWMRKEAMELVGKMETLYAEISDVLDSLEEKCKSFGHEWSDTNELQDHIMGLKDLLKKERNDYNGLLQLAIMGTSQPGRMAVDILELNRLRRSLLVGSHVWDRQLYSLDSLLKKSSISKTSQGDASYAQLKELKSYSSYKDGNLDLVHEENNSKSSKLQEPPGNDLQSQNDEANLPPIEPYIAEDSMLTACHHNREEEIHSDGEITVNKTLSKSVSSHVSNLSERIDSAWTGTNQLVTNAQPLHTSHADGLQPGCDRQVSQNANPPFRRLMMPMRVHSFDSAIRVQDRIRKGLPPSSLHLSTCTYLFLEFFQFHVLLTSSIYLPPKFFAAQNSQIKGTYSCYCCNIMELINQGRPLDSLRLVTNGIEVVKRKTMSTNKVDMVNGSRQVVNGANLVRRQPTTPVPVRKPKVRDSKQLPSDENYNSLQRSIDVWSFVLSFRVRVLLDNAKWAYLGGFTEDKQKNRRRKTASWLRERVLQLGPTFIKLGQLSSTRSDLFPPEFVDELAKLQDKVPAFSPEKARGFIESELGAPIDILFKEFEDWPIAAASLGQVHRASLHNGEKVVVKVQRPGLKKLFDIDLRNLKLIAEYFQRSETLGGPTRDWMSIYEECATVLYQEIDYINEGKNADRFRRDFRNIKWVRVPLVYWDYTAFKVLTMEYLPGIKINQLDMLDSCGYNRSQISSRAIEAYLIQILGTGFFHADPHPGNLAIDANEAVLIYYDFGMMGEIKSSTRERLLELFYAVYERDTKKVVQSLVDLEVLQSKGDMSSVRKSLQFFLDNLLSQKPDQQQTLAAIGEDLFAIALDQPLWFPSTITFVLKAFSTLEGIGYILDPDFSFVKIAAPYAQELLDARQKQQSGTKLVEEIRKQADEARTYTISMPYRVQRIEAFVKQLESGDLKLRVRVLESERAARKATVLQMATMHTVLGGTLLNLGVTFSSQGSHVLANGSFIGAGVFMALFLRCMQREKKLDRFEKMI